MRQPQFQLKRDGVRNAPGQEHMMASMVNPGMAAAPMPTPAGDGPEPLTSSMLAATSPQEQKQMLGERLFPLIQVKMNFRMTSFFSFRKSGRSITAAPDKIFTHTFFEGIDKG